MKAKNIVLAALLCVIVLAMVVYKRGSFKRNAQYKQKITAEQENVLLELEELNKEIEGLKADLNVLKLGDADYVKEVREMMGKQAQLQAHNTTPKIGVVRIRAVFQNCKKNSEYQEQLAAEQNRIIAELEKLSKEVKTLKADLKTRKPGSSDYSNLMQQMMDKQAQLGARKEFYQQQMMLKDQQWTEQLYEEILEAVGRVAKAKGLDMVLEKEELDFPTISQTELMLVIRTHKLLYSVDGLDITKEVIKLLNAED